MAQAWPYVAVARLRPGRVPAATPEKVHLSRRYEFFDASKAVGELGLPQTPARRALHRAGDWYEGRGSCSGSQVQRTQGQVRCTWGAGQGTRPTRDAIANLESKIVAACRGRAGVL